MNKADRAELQKAIDLIDDAKGIIESIAESEQEKFDNLTEGLQASERGQQFEQVANDLSEAVSALEDVVNTIDGVMG